MKSFYILLLTVAIGVSQTLAEQKTGNTINLKQQLVDLIDDNQAVTELAGIQVVLIKDGKIAFEHAAGMAHLGTEGNVIPLTIDHKVRVASISKFVMALGFMTLVEESKVDLDADVSDYLGFKLANPNFPDSPITSRQLLSHTSSIRDAGVYFLAHGEAFQDFFRPSEHYQDGAHFASEKGQGPGQYFTYSNLNFGILAGIIERVSGQRFDLFMEQSLFKPLGLNVSFNNCQFSNEGHQYIATLYRRGEGGYTWDPEGPWKPQVDDSIRRCYYGGPKVSSDKAHDVSELDDYVLGSNPTLFSPQGGLRASARDLAKLILLLSTEADLQGAENDAVLSRDTIAAMLTPVWQYNSNAGNGHTGGESDPDDVSAQGLQRTYGLSTHIINLKDWKLAQDDYLLYGHMASAYGLLGQLWFNPESKDGIVILLTGMGSDPGAVPRTTPMEEIEAQVLRIALQGLKQL